MMSPIRKRIALIGGTLLAALATGDDALLKVGRSADCRFDGDCAPSQVSLLKTVTQLLALAGLPDGQCGAPLSEVAS